MLCAHYKIDIAVLLRNTCIVAYGTGDIFIARTGSTLTMPFYIILVKKK